jgi:hypothetical protein
MEVPHADIAGANIGRQILSSLIESINWARRPQKSAPAISAFGTSVYLSALLRA